jgi:hypothetical protein
MGFHPDFVEGYEGTLEELAFHIGNLRYDKGVELLIYSARDFERQAVEDLAAGHPQLSIRLFETADSVYDAAEALSRAWIISKKYM